MSDFFGLVLMLGAISLGLMSLPIVIMILTFIVVYVIITVDQSDSE